MKLFITGFHYLKTAVPSHSTLLPSKSPLFHIKHYEFLQRSLDTYHHLVTLLLNTLNFSLKMQLLETRPKVQIHSNQHRIHFISLIMERILLMQLGTSFVFLFFKQLTLLDLSDYGKTKLLKFSIKSG